MVSDKLLSQILSELQIIKGDMHEMKLEQKTIKGDMHEMKLEQKTLSQRMFSMENKVEAIQKQTVANAEQLASLKNDVQEIINDNKSIQGVVGEHEISIRSLRRKPV